MIDSDTEVRVLMKRKRSSPSRGFKCNTQCSLRSENIKLNCLCWQRTNLDFSNPCKIVWLLCLLCLEAFGHDLQWNACIQLNHSEWVSEFSQAMRGSPLLSSGWAWSPGTSIVLYSQISSSHIGSAGLQSKHSHRETQPCRQERSEKWSQSKRLWKAPNFTQDEWPVDWQWASVSKHSVRESWHWCIRKFCMSLLSLHTSDTLAL